MTDIKTKLAQYHHPELIANPEDGDGAHVCQVWEDGEITLTKGGSLWGQRNLHMIEAPFKRALPIESMPMNDGKHGYAVISYGDLDEVRMLMWHELGID